MKTNVLFENLQDNKYTFTVLSQEVKWILEYLGIVDPEVTGIVSLQEDGEYIAIWLTTGSRPYDLYCWYRPLPCYFYGKDVSKYPECFQDTNQYYQ
jgi:hypothetical protein